MHLWRKVKPYPNECPEYDTKQSDDEALVLELRGMWSTPSLALLVDSLQPRVVIPIKVPSMGQIELLI